MSISSSDAHPVVVSGAASGIGAHLAELLVASGRPVIGLDRSTSMPAGVEPLRIDLAEPEQIDAATERLRSTIARLGGLANVAGIPGTAEPDLVLRVNWLAARRLMLATSPQLRGGGAIVNVASLAGHHVEYADQVDELIDLADEELLEWARQEQLGGSAAYDLSKKLLIRYGRRVAAEGVRSNLRCNTVSPGPVRTPILDDFQASMHGSVERSAAWVGRHAEPGEVAAPAAFLLSNAASWINGIDVVADGGLLAARQEQSSRESLSHPTPDPVASDSGQRR